PQPGACLRSARHDGAACLEIDPERTRNRLVGWYFTDRSTKGRIELIRKSHQIVNTGGED
ncbi:MAG: hypothetical protein ACREB3_16175, partial [Burkholderiales bacterium]